MEYTSTSKLAPAIRNTHLCENHHRTLLFATTWLPGKKQRISSSTKKLLLTIKSYVGFKGKRFEQLIESKLLLSKLSRIFFHVSSPASHRDVS